MSIITPKEDKIDSNTDYGSLNACDGWVPPCPLHLVPRIRRHCPPHFLQPTSRSRPIFFETYVPRERLDDSPARLDNFPTDSRQLRLFTWNVESFIDVGEYSQFQEIILTLPKGIYCLQETKATHSDVLKLSHTHLYLSGTTDDPHTGVGFAIPTPFLPIVYDFPPWNWIAVLILNTKNKTSWPGSLYNVCFVNGSGPKTWPPT